MVSSCVQVSHETSDSCQPLVCSWTPYFFHCSGMGTCYCWYPLFTYVKTKQTNPLSASFPVFLFSSPPPPAVPLKLVMWESYSVVGLRGWKSCLPMARAMCPWAICYYYRQKLCIALGWKIKSTVHDLRRWFSDFNQSIAQVERKERL